MIQCKLQQLADGSQPFDIQPPDACWAVSHGGAVTLQE
jgi:hypothetical protein